MDDVKVKMSLQRLLFSLTEEDSRRKLATSGLSSSSSSSTWLLNSWEVVVVVLGVLEKLREEVGVVQDRSWPENRFTCIPTTVLATTAAP